MHLEIEFHGLQQSEMSVSAYYHRLRTLSDALADCELLVGDQALVHQLICCFGPQFHTLRTILPALPQFPSFVQA